MRASSWKDEAKAAMAGSPVTGGADRDMSRLGSGHLPSGCWSPSTIPASPPPDGTRCTGHRRGRVPGGQEPEKGREIDITDEMSSRANESGFVFFFPAALLCFVYCRRARLWRKDPTDDAFSIPCVRFAWSTDEKACLYVQCQPWRMRRTERGRSRHQDVMTRWRKLRAKLR